MIQKKKNGNLVTVIYDSNEKNVTLFIICPPY